MKRKLYKQVKHKEIKQKIIYFQNITADFQRPWKEKNLFILDH